MSLVELLPAASGLEGVLAHRAPLAEKYRSFRSSFRDDGHIPTRVLEIVRRRVAYIHGCEAELAVVDNQVTLNPDEEAALRVGDHGAFSPAEQAALALAELVPHGVHTITDEMVHAVSAHFGHAGCVALLTAIAFIDVECRLKMVFAVPVESDDASAKVSL